MSYLVVCLVPRYFSGIFHKKYWVSLILCYSNFLELFCFFSENTLLGLNLLMDMWSSDSVADFFSRRFEVTYNLLNIKSGFRVFFRVYLPEFESLYSVECLYIVSSWLERELWDLFGVTFKLNSDLRRILTDYGFFGCPLRKDFPLLGYIELRYHEGYGHIIFDPVEFSQELRFFNFESL